MNRKFSFASDLDNSILDFDRPYFEFCNKRLGTNIKYNEIFSANYWEILNIPKEEAIHLVHEFQETKEFSNLNFIDGAKENISLLSERYGKFPILTSRDNKFELKTKRHIERILPLSISDVYHCDQHFDQNGRSKAHICDQLGIDVLIEDNVNHSIQCADIGVRVLLLDRPWNQNFSYSNVVRVRDWYEIKDILLRENKNGR